MSSDKKKDVVVNIKPFHCELKCDSNTGSFSLEFLAPMGDDYSRRKRVRVHFDGWWLSYLAGCLWAVLKKRRAKLENDEKSMRGE